MFTESDYDKLQQIMDETPEKKELLAKLLKSHQMDISTISHEVRNPLTLVYSTLQLIESEHPEVRSFNHWSDLRSDIEYMKQLLEELSSYNNSSMLTLAQIHSDTFLKALALSFATSLIDTDIEFTSHIEPDLPVFTGDQIKLREVLLNLLKNARDAVCESEYSGHDKPQIILDTTSTDTDIIIKVSDNGYGIPHTNLETIFEPFITYKKDGTGLGLAIANRIARMHGGSLTAVSAPGIRTTFTLTLPIQQDSQ